MTGLGFRLPVPVSYDVWLTLLSLILAVAGSGFSLAMAARDPVGTGKLIGAGTLTGIAIVSMHYTGMAAASFAPGSVSAVHTRQLLNPTILAVVLGAASLVFLMAMLLVSAY
ncbi:MAG TPA: MHYT domain-containing protein, partial [Steroidobacteraceae bacterium]|nr:MHYT domain-containing protein [Steroidobacteraceae bacterium]